MGAFKHDVPRALSTTQEKGDKRKKKQGQTVHKIEWDREGDV